MVMMMMIIMIGGDNSSHDIRIELNGTAPHMTFAFTYIVGLLNKDYNIGMIVKIFQTFYRNKSVETFLKIFY